MPLQSLQFQVFDSVGDDESLVCSNALLDGYVGFGEMEVAQKLFEEVPEKDSFSWTVLINRYSKCGQVEFGSISNKKALSLRLLLLFFWFPTSLWQPDEAEEDKE